MVDAAHTRFAQRILLPPRPTTEERNNVRAAFCLPFSVARRAAFVSCFPDVRYSCCCGDCLRDATLCLPPALRNGTICAGADLGGSHAAAQNAFWEMFYWQRWRATQCILAPAGFVGADRSYAPLPAAAALRARSHAPALLAAAYLLPAVLPEQRLPLALCGRCCCHSPCARSAAGCGSRRSGAAVLGLVVASAFSCACDCNGSRLALHLLHADAAPVPFAQCPAAPYSSGRQRLMGVRRASAARRWTRCRQRCLRRGAACLWRRRSRLPIARILLQFSSSTYAAYWHRSGCSFSRAPRTCRRLAPPGFYAPHRATPAARNLKRTSLFLPAPSRWRGKRSSRLLPAAAVSDLRITA